MSMQEFPSGMLICVGGMVAARSVKVVGQEGKQERAVEARDAWWGELREEIKTHTRSLDCCHVIGYTETTSITEEGVCVLSATGTAAILDASRSQRKAAMTSMMQINMVMCPKPYLIYMICAGGNIPY